MFYKKVNKSSRKEMVSFLENHFRYYTMNSWNNADSYSNKVKIYNLDLTSEQEDKFFELSSMNLLSDFYIDIGELFINDFTKETGYTIIFNGRNSGYIVLCDCEKEWLDYKSYCRHCGRLNYKTVEESGNCRCGNCGKDERVNLQHQLYRWKTLMHSIDKDENFSDKEEWPLYRLKERVELVQKFDKLCDDIRDYLIQFLDSHEIGEEEYTATRKVLKEV